MEENKMDLWPEDIGVKPVKQRAPVMILREQASLLGQKTQNLIKGSVHQKSNIQEHGRLDYSFNILAPTLDNYRYNLFSITHEIELYPAEISPDDEIFKQIKPDMWEKRESQIDSDMWDEHEANVRITVNSEEEFITVLRKILNSEKTKKVIDSLLALLDFAPASPPPDDDIPF